MMSAVVGGRSDGPDTLRIGAIVPLVACIISRCGTLFLSADDADPDGTDSTKFQEETPQSQTQIITDKMVQGRTD